MVTLAALPSFAHATELHLATQTRDNYRIKVMSWWEIPFRSVIRQQYDFSCGSAAVATLLTFHYGHEISEWDSFRAMWEAGDQDAIRELGFSMLEMKTFLESIGYKVEGYRMSLDQLASFDRPSIVLLEQDGYKHFVVLKGASRDRFLIGDPMTGVKTYSVEELGSQWNGIALAIVAGPSDRLPTYNSSQDWSPWATAPVANAATPDLTSDITTHLPPTYQLTPALFVDTPL